MLMNNLYGVFPSDLEEVKSILEMILGVNFDPKDSLYHGEYYQFGQSHNEHFVLKRNVDPLDGEPAEMNFPNFPVLLYANYTRRSSELNDLLGKLPLKFTLLRQTNS